MNSLERRAEILEVLSRNKYSTIKILSERFNVSTTTIKRDIEILSMDYPIYTTQGKNGGIFVDSDWKFEKKYLNNNQMKVLNKFINSNRTSDIDKATLITILNDFSIPQKAE